MRNSVIHGLKVYACSCPYDKIRDVFYETENGNGMKIGKEREPDHVSSKQK